MIPDIHLKSSHELHYQLSVLDSAGNVVQELPVSKNLILDSGLDSVGTLATLPTLIGFVLFGTAASPTPVRRDSGAVTISQSGTTATASASFFSAADVGRLIKYNNGPATEVYITAFTSATVVTVGTSATIASINATVWYVNETALDTFYASSSALDSGGSAHGTTWSGNVQTMKRTLISAPVAGPVTLTEIGFNGTGANSNLFDRDIIVGGISLVTGNIARVVVTLITTFTPTTPLSVSNVATGFNSAGTLQIESAYNPNGGVSCFADINTSGYTTGEAQSVTPNILDASIALTAAFTQQAFSTTVASNSAAGVSSDGGTLASYTNGHFYRDKTHTWSVGAANTTIYGFALGWSNYRFISLLLTSSFAKSNSQTLSITWRLSWGRTLAN
jgi:hypothetical protein